MSIDYLKISIFSSSIHKYILFYRCLKWGTKTVDEIVKNQNFKQSNHPGCDLNSKNMVKNRNWRYNKFNFQTNQEKTLKAQILTSILPNTSQKELHSLNI